ncbi:MAG TPA: archease [Candidatus Hydrothermia bacterium]|nr:archease [Candidatus Hydrothermia bacterium]
MPYEILNHTADFGVRITGKTLEELFESGSQAIIDAMVEFKGHGAWKSIPYKDEAETLEDLLVDFLSEVIFRTVVEYKVFVKCQLVISEFTLDGVLYFEDFDPSIHRLKKEIKSVTYHNLSIKKTANGYETEIICDV